MGRIEVVVRTHTQDDNVTAMFWLREPRNVANAGDLRTLNDDVSVAPFDQLATMVHGEPAFADDGVTGLVQIAGQEVYKRLTQHPGVKTALEAAVVEPSNQTRTLHICLSNADAENLPWEAIFLPTEEFVAMDSRWRLSRVVEAGSESPDRTFDGTLRVVAILGAEDRFVELQWHALLANLADTPVQFDLLVLSCKQELTDEINALGDDRIAAKMITNSESGLMRDVARHRPQLLHVFSHGTPEYEGRLVISHRGSELAGEDPLYIGAPDLRQLAGDLWLASLNTCRGAESVDRLQSLASSLVSQGVPAVVAMREAIDSRDAHIFCRAFFDSVLDTIHQRLQVGGTVELDWEGALQFPRVKLAEQHPGPAPEIPTQWKAWSVPVLYRCSEPLRIHVASAAQEQIREEIEMLRSLRADLHPDTAAAKFQRLDARIAELEAQLSGGV